MSADAGSVLFYGIKVNVTSENCNEDRFEACDDTCEVFFTGNLVAGGFGDELHAYAMVKSSLKKADCYDENVLSPAALEITPVEMDALKAFVKKYDLPAIGEYGFRMCASYG